jgi:hypothetical protein
MKTYTIPLTLLALGVLLLAGVLLLKPIDNAFGGAFTGSASYLQTATTTTVGPQTKITIASAQTDGSCKARVITTNYTGVFLSFGDTTGFGSTTLANGVGHWQPASTTVAYDGEIYGCGHLTGYATASTTLTVSQF